MDSHRRVRVSVMVCCGGVVQEMVGLFVTG